MNLAEGRRDAEKEGTERWEKFKSAGKTTVWVLATLFALGLITYWTVGAINSGPQQASTPRHIEAYRTLAVTSDCPGKSETFDLAAGQEKVINTNYCQLRWKIRSGSLKAFSSGNTEIAGKVEPGGETSVPPGLYKVMALSSLRLTRTECGRQATGNNLNTCD